MCQARRAVLSRYIVESVEAIQDVDAGGRVESAESKSGPHFLEGGGPGRTYQLPNAGHPDAGVGIEVLPVHEPEAEVDFLRDGVGEKTREPCGLCLQDGDRKALEEGWHEEEIRSPQDCRDVGPHPQKPDVVVGIGELRLQLGAKRTVADEEAEGGKTGGAELQDELDGEPLVLGRGEARDVDDRDGVSGDPEIGPEAAPVECPGLLEGRDVEGIRDQACTLRARAEEKLGGGAAARAIVRGGRHDEALEEVLLQLDRTPWRGAAGGGVVGVRDAPGDARESGREAGEGPGGIHVLVQGDERAVGAKHAADRADVGDGAQLDDAADVPDPSAEVADFPVEMPRARRVDEEVKLKARPVDRPVVVHQHRLDAAPVHRGDDLEDARAGRRLGSVTQGRLLREDR